MRFLIALVLLGGIAAAQPSAGKEAKAHFTKGEALLAGKRYREAIAEYEAAYELVPHPSSLYNIALCYENLGEWSQSADYYERYLDDQKGAAPDQDAVTDKIKLLRARTQPGPGPGPMPTPTPTPVPEPPPGIRQPWDTTQSPRTVGKPYLHLGVSYGLGVGDAPVERYLAHGGFRFGKRLDADAIFGVFGKNDRGAGVMVRVLLPGSRIATPYLRGTATIGIAKEDNSSIATTKFPLGFEAGGGLQLGVLAHFEVDAVLRFTRGGFDSSSTMADSYINDTLAFAVDLGFVTDLGITSGGR